ncbi:MAG: hypothetical protein OFPII_30180 [Osedax symbiont Rs1]|nr:MAG: hypothetical protein OFPII_30180 [Osedax symbiont Rs1]
MPELMRPRKYWLYFLTVAFLLFNQAVIAHQLEADNAVHSQHDCSIYQSLKLAISAATHSVSARRCHAFNNLDQKLEVAYAGYLGALARGPPMAVDYSLQLTFS